MKQDKAAWAGSALFALMIAPAIIRPSSRASLGSLEPPWAHPLVARDLDAIERDTLRVLVIRDPLTWEEHPGAVSGLEWELLKRFAHEENLTMLAVPVDNPDSLLMLLQRGEGDVVAAQLCPDGWARGFANFTGPYRSVAPLRVALNSDPLVRATGQRKYDPDEPDTLVISRWSCFGGLDALFDTTRGGVTLITDTALPEDVLTRVSLGLCGAALMPDAIGTVDARRMPQVAFGPRLGRSVPLAFAVRTNAPLLLRALNGWLSSPLECEARVLLTDNYGDGPLTKGPIRGLRALEFSADSISPFDSLFQLHADSSAYDWELLCAVAFKESRFDTTAVSGAGAGGLMQIMPRTARALGVDSADGLKGHIGGATRYLAKLDTIWRGSVPNKDQRLKFVLASYNAGPGHIKDAQRLAELYGLDPRRWDGSVERALLLLSRPRWFARADVKNGYCRGYETFWFVRDVVSAFRQFSKNKGK